MPVTVEIIKEEEKSPRVFKNYAKGFFSGVCYGVAKHFDINITLLRIMWLISCCFYGFGILSYIILTIFLPEEKKRV